MKANCVKTVSCLKVPQYVQSETEKENHVTLILLYVNTLIFILIYRQNVEFLAMENHE